MDLNLHSEGRAHYGDRPYVAFADGLHGSSVSVTAARTIAAPSGSGWYHDAAIEAARQYAIEARCNPYG